MKWLTGPHNVLYGAQIPQRDLLWPQPSNLLAPLSLCCWSLQKYIKQGMCPNWRKVIPHNWTLLQLVLVPLGQSCSLRTLEVFSSSGPEHHYPISLLPCTHLRRNFFPWCPSFFCECRTFSHPTMLVPSLPNTTTTWYHISSLHLCSIQPSAFLQCVNP